MPHTLSLENVDQTLMRGLASPGPGFTSGLPRSQVGLMLVWRAESPRGLPDRPPRPAVWIGSPFLLLRVVSRQTVAWGSGMTVVAMAQSKAASSRAMATVDDAEK